MTFYKVSMVNLVTFLLTALCFFCQTSHAEDYSSCGVRSVHRGKIFGGLLSRPGMWPWQVAIFRKIRDERQRPRFRCGGALINSRWVLSAAHCFHKRPHEEYIDYSYTVKAGEYKIDIKDPHEQERNAFRIHNHPHFVPSTYENDIALIELDKGVKMGPHVRSICLPKANEILTTSGEVVSVAGWGYTTKGSHSSVLLYSAFEIQTNKKCADTTRYLYNETVMFCAGQSKGGNDTCKGDSGGSTVRQVLQDGRRRWVTVGLVSWGEECGIKGKYGYYTRMEPFVPWIEDKINGSSLSCGNPGSIRNGRIIGSEFLVGFTVKYICNEEYRMRGRSTRRCRRNGKWTKAPTCLKVECRNPGTPRYGVRRPRRNKYYYKDKIRFRCKTNYTIVGRSAMRCRSDGTWSGFKPVCQAPCKDPGIPAGGIRLDHSFKHSQTVRFLCRKRDQPPSVSFLTCTNGKWNQNIPRCTADCDDPGTPINGQRQGDDFTFNKRVYFTCDRGYMRVGPAYLQCQSNRRWSDKTPICQHLFCIRPKLPENAYIYGRGQLKEKYGFDEVVMFQCKKGYSASGSPFVRCLADGWTKTNLRCLPVECRDPGRLVNGGKYPVKNKYVFKDSIRFQCKTNYTIRGDSSITCQHNKRWSGNIPRCLASCRDPGVPNNGRRLDHSFLHNYRVRFSCRRGWNINGSQTITCDNGNWDHQTPQCLVPTCAKPTPPDNSYITRNLKVKYRYYEVVMFRCDHGYYPSGPAFRRCLSNGWSNSIFRCIRVECKDLGILRNGVRRPEQMKYVYEDRIDFRCKTNHTMRGNTFIICQSDRTWTGTVPYCSAPCTDPGIPVGGQRYQHSFLHNSVVQFRCNSGWSMQGSADTIRCTDGRWDHNPPTCNKGCLKPTDYPTNGGIYGSTRYYSHKTSIRYYCGRGYNLFGQEYLRCLNGTWENRQPTCRPVECRDPGRLVNGGKYPEQNKYVFKDSIRFQCKRNYTIRGDSSITCQHNKRWSGNIPTCLAPCRDPGIPNNGRRLDHSFLHNDRVRFSCQRGWNIDGFQTIRCDNGNWDHPTPQCLECGSPLGMAIDGRIPDGNIQASSTRWTYHARNGRLNGPYAWCSGTARSPYLQIDFGKPYRIAGLATQGSAHDNRWVERYTVSSNLAGSSFNTYREDNRDKIFDGNRDKGSTVKNRLRKPLIVRRLRIHPQKEGGFSRLSPACMRVEIYGCDLPSDCIAVGSRIVAKWAKLNQGYYIFLKAYLTDIGFFWKVELENENHGRPAQKYVAKYTDLPFVLDVPPRHEELQVGTRVLAPWWFRWYTCTIKAGRNGYNKYLVMGDDGDQKEFTIDQMRLLKAPVFC